MWKQKLVVAKLMLVVFLVGMVPVGSDGATCTGSDPCHACKNCKYCRHCAKEGGKCGVCK
jgi:hypothetical protein